MNEHFSSADWNFLDGADAYDTWYDRVILYCLRAGAKRFDEDGFVHSFDHRSNRVVSNKRKAPKIRKKTTNLGGFLINHGGMSIVRRL